MKKFGQQTVEYAIVLGVLSVVLMSMYVYIKRGIQATIKHSADQLGSQHGRAISYANSTSNTSETSSSETRVSENSGAKQMAYTDDTQTTSQGVTTSITD